MIVCLCEGINDRTIEDTVRQGARNVREIARACGAGTGCGLCRRDVKDILEKARPGGEPSGRGVLSK